MGRRIFASMELSSRQLQRAVDQLASLPGIGRKTALRLTLHLLKQSPEVVQAFGEAFIKLKDEVKFCEKCHNLSDAELCNICLHPKRDESLICVVEDIRDIMALENTGQYNGMYHVLGGVISPMEGIGPGDLHIDSLLNRVEQGEVKEIILALSATMEGDTTNFYLFRKLKDRNLKLSTIARGVAIGDELEYTDEITLGRSIINRLPYESTLSR